MKKPAAIKVNLLPKDPFLNTPIGKLLQWALSVGRYLVIFTELVVIVSFASRFTLDRRITDLNSAIHQKEIVIQSFGEVEQNIRDTQKKITSYQQVEQQENVAAIFPVLTAVTPQDVSLTELQMRPGKVTISGTSPSNVSLGLLINNLQVSGRFTDITIERIGTAKDSNSGLGFKIEATVKKVVTQNGSSIQ
jgi:Tfp pilus assembly protein PilN